MKKNIYYIFIDDERDIMFDRISNKVGYTYAHCYNYEQAIKSIEMNKNIQMILDFDHDIGENKTGYDIAKYVVENNIKLYGYKIHSMNPVGKDNIRQLLNHYGYRELY